MARTISLLLALPMLIAGALLPTVARAQSQDSQTQSVAEAARKARGQKKAAAKPATVITEDMLKPPTEAEKAVEAANDAQASANAGKTPESGAAAKPEAKPDSAPKSEDAKKKKEKAELEALKQRLAAAKKSLDLLQRELALDQDTYLANPDHVRDTAGKAKLEGIKQQITDKQQEVDVLKTKVAALQELLGTDAPADATPQQ